MVCHLKSSFFRCKNFISGLLIMLNMSTDVEECCMSACCCQSLLNLHTIINKFRITSRTIIKWQCNNRFFWINVFVNPTLVKTIVFELRRFKFRCYCWFWCWFACSCCRISSSCSGNKYNACNLNGFQRFRPTPAGIFIHWLNVNSNSTTTQFFIKWNRHRCSIRHHIISKCHTIIISCQGSLWTSQSNLAACHFRSIFSIKWKFISNFNFLEITQIKAGI